MLRGHTPETCYVCKQQTCFCSSKTMGSKNWNKQFEVELPSTAVIPSLKRLRSRFLSKVPSRDGKTATVREIAAYRSILRLIDEELNGTAPKI